MATTQWVARPMLASLGPRRSFERGSLMAAVAYVVLSQACRPIGAPGWRIAAQYVAAKCLLMTPVSTQSPHHISIFRDLSERLRAPSGASQRGSRSCHW